jgi:type IX secretion system PorP/SprF family membrane protein
MHSIRKIYFIAAGICAAQFSFAQDPFFSQTYSAPMALNPALAGSTGSGRISGVVKTIGTDIAESYKAYHFAYDQMVNKLKSGIGIYMTAENSRDNLFLARRYGLNWAVPINIIKSKKLKIAPAVELAYQSYELNLDPGFVLDSNFRSKVLAMDVGTGLLINSERLNLGVVMKHLNQPNLSFSKTGKAPLYSRISVVTDYVFGKLDEKRAWKIAPGVRYNYSEQLGVNDLMVTISAVYHKFKFGLGYRNDAQDPSNNFATAQVSYNGLLFKFRYCYDFYTKEVTGGRPSGHEMTLLFNIFGKKKKDDFTAAPNYAY